MSDQSTQTELASAEAKKEIHIPNPDPFHQTIDLRFGFRTLKDEKTGVETKREAVEVKLNVLNFDGVVAVLNNYSTTIKDLESTDEALKAAAVQNKKAYDLLMSSIQGVYESSIKDFLADNPEVTSANFPHDKFSWTAIANEPESERRGRGIAKEVWEALTLSYKAEMAALTGKKQESIDKQAAIIAQKFNPLRNHEDKEKILPNFKQALTVYMNGSPNAEQFAGAIQFLMEKIDKMLSSDKNADLAANLGFE